MRFSARGSIPHAAAVRGTTALRRLSLPCGRGIATGTIDPDLYSRMFEAHMHPEGPWERMVARAGQALPHPAGMGNKVLDLATGPGEPAALMAEIFPRVMVCATDSSEGMVVKAQALLLCKAREPRPAIYSHLRCHCATANITDPGRNSP